MAAGFDARKFEDKIGSLELLFNEQNAIDKMLREELITANQLKITLLLNEMMDCLSHQARSISHDVVSHKARMDEAKTTYYTLQHRSHELSASISELQASILPALSAVAKKTIPLTPAQLSILPSEIKKMTSPETKKPVRLDDRMGDLSTVLLAIELAETSLINRAKQFLAKNIVDEELAKAASCENYYDILNIIHSSLEHPLKAELTSSVTTYIDSLKASSSPNAYIIEQLYFCFKLMTQARKYDDEIRGRKISEDAGNIIATVDFIPQLSNSILYNFFLAVKINSTFSKISDKQELLDRKDKELKQESIAYYKLALETLKTQHTAKDRPKEVTKELVTMFLARIHRLEEKIPLIKQEKFETMHGFAMLVASLETDILALQTQLKTLKEKSDSHIGPQLSELFSARSAVLNESREKRFWQSLLETQALHDCRVGKSATVYPQPSASPSEIKSDPYIEIERAIRAITFYLDRWFLFAAPLYKTKFDADERLASTSYHYFYRARPIELNLDKMAEKMAILKVHGMTVMQEICKIDAILIAAEVAFYEFVYEYQKDSITYFDHDQSKIRQACELKQYYEKIGRKKALALSKYEDVMEGLRDIKQDLDMMADIERRKAGGADKMSSKLRFAGASAGAGAMISPVYDSLIRPSTAASTKPGPGLKR